MLTENRVPTVPIRYTHTLVVSCDLGSFAHFGPSLAVSLCLVTVQPVEAGLAAQNNTGASGECSHPPFFLHTDFHIQTYIQSLQYQFSTFCGANDSLASVFCPGYAGAYSCVHVLHDMRMPNTKKTLRRMTIQYWRSDWVLAL